MNRQKWICIIAWYLNILRPEGHAAEALAVGPQDMFVIVIDIVIIIVIIIIDYYNYHHCYHYYYYDSYNLIMFYLFY